MAIVKRLSREIVALAVRVQFPLVTPKFILAKIRAVLALFYMSLLSEKAFVFHCRRRGLKITVDFLKLSRQRGIIVPLVEEEKTSLYHPFQVIWVAEVIGLVKTKSALSKKNVPLKKQLQLLLPLRSYLRFTLEKGTNLDLTSGQVEKLRDRLLIKGRQIDPMRSWYVFLRTIRLCDPQKFGTLDGVVLLAHDYYTLAETLTSLYGEQFGGKLLLPEDLADGRAGTWKIAQCEKCHENMRITDFEEKFCESCKKDVALSTPSGALKCRCGAILLKYADGPDTFNQVLPYDKGGRRPVYTYLSYGKLVVQVQCQCGEVVSKEFEQGWF